jgi:hypothetical protein
MVASLKRGVHPAPFARTVAAIIVIAGVIIGLAPVGASAQSDDEIRALIAKAGDAKEHPDAPFVAVFEKTDVTVEESGLAHFRRHNLTKILTEEGVKERAALRFDYDPASNFINVESVRIFRKGGAVETVDLSMLRDLFAPASMIYWGARMKLLGLPRLEVGDAVEVKTYKKGFEIAYLDDAGDASGAGTAACPGVGATGTRRGTLGGGPADTSSADDARYIPPMRGHFYDVVLFQDAYPMMEKRYTLHMPKDKPIQYEVYNGALYSAQSFDEKGTHYSWWRTDIPALVEEPRSAEPPDVATKLVLATLPSWQEKSRWFAAIHDTIYTDNQAIRDKVRELTAGFTTDVERVAALQHWAAQEIRYSGLSMGKGEGYTHHPGTMSFRDRCGVCKDKAGMLVTLMRSAGYDVWPALTMAGSRVERVPADQFNHSVVAWRHKDGSFTMLDPTWVPYSNELWSSAEQEQNYVIGTPSGEGLMETPYSPPEQHVLKIISRGAVDTRGNLAGTLRIEATNYMDQRMRRYLGTHKKDDLRAYVEGWLAAISPSVVVEQFSIGDPLDFKKQFALDVRYRVPGYAIATERSLDFASPAWKLGFGTPPLLVAASVIGSEKREYPLFIWYTQTLQCDESITVPGNLKPRELARQSEQSGAYAAFTMERSLSGAVLKNDGRVLVKRRTIPADQYGAFRGILKDAGDYATERIVFER